ASVLAFDCNVTEVGIVHALTTASNKCATAVVAILMASLSESHAGLNADEHSHRRHLGSESGVEYHGCQFGGDIERELRADVERASSTEILTEAAPRMLLFAFVSRADVRPSIAQPAAEPEVICGPVLQTRPPVFEMEPRPVGETEGRPDETSRQRNIVAHPATPAETEAPCRDGIAPLRGCCACSGDNVAPHIEQRATVAPGVRPRRAVPDAHFPRDGRWPPACLER